MCPWESFTGPRVNLKSFKFITLHRSAELSYPWHGNLRKNSRFTPSHCGLLTQLLNTFHFTQHAPSRKAIGYRQFHMPEGGENRPPLCGPTFVMTAERAPYRWREGRPQRGTCFDHTVVQGTGWEPRSSHSKPSSFWIIRATSLARERHSNFVA